MVEFRIHDWFKPSCLDGLRVQVPLRVKKLCSSGAMGDTADLGSVALWYVGSSPTLSIMLLWWNGIHVWLRTRCPRELWVRVSSEVLFCSVGETGKRCCLKSSFRKDSEFDSQTEHHRILAQLELEQATSNRQVIGSSPICPRFWVCNSMVRMHGSYPCRCKFDSYRTQFTECSVMVAYLFWGQVVRVQFLPFRIFRGVKVAQELLVLLVLVRVQAKELRDIQ